MCLETFNNIYRALDQMRSSSVIPDTETNEEMRQRVTEECKWFVWDLQLLSLSVACLLGLIIVHGRCVSGHVVRSFRIHH